MPRILLRIVIVLITSLVCRTGVTAEPGPSSVGDVALQAAADADANPPDDQPWQSKPLASVRLDVLTVDGEVPADPSPRVFTTSPVGAGQAASRPPAVFHWVPSNFAYQPPYFDDVPLERYGQSVCPALQPLLSGAHFFGMFPIMPYKMGIDRTHDPIYSLGYYRIGDDAPAVRQRLPFEWDAALFEAGAWTGMVFVLP